MKGGAGPGGFNLGDLGGLFKQAQDMQRRILKIQEELKERVVEFAAGGGMVSAQANGEGELVALKVQKDVVDPSDVGMLEDLVVAAVNGALKKAKELRDREMAKITGGLGGLPGMGGLAGLMGG
jgi:hypothetical protein